MEHARFTSWWLSTFVGFCLLQIAVAVGLDPYCVFGIVRFPKQNFEPNSRFLKIEYLRHRPEFDAFILGSSRASYYGADTAEAVCPGQHRYFNLSVSLENGIGMRRKVEWLLNHRRLNHVILNLDFDIQSVPTDALDLLRQDHPSVTRSSELGFYAKYLLFQPRILFLFASANLNRDAGHGIAPWNMGNALPPDSLYPTRPAVELRRLHAVTLGALRNDLSRLGKTEDRGSLNGIEEFRNTIQLLDRSGVDRILIIPPYRIDQFASFDIDALASWLTETVRIAGSVWDFSGLNSVTADPANYVDPVHFNRSVGDRVLERACKTDSTSVDFGVHVTPTNLGAHLHNLQLQHARAQQLANLADRGH